MLSRLTWLSQRDRAAGLVSFGWVVGDGVSQILPNVVSARKLKALIFCLINPLLHEKRSLCIFEPLFGDLEAMYAVHLRLMGKPVVNFLLVVIELFSLGAMFEALRVNIHWKSPFLKGVGHFGPTFPAEGDVPHQPFVHG